MWDGNFPPNGHERCRCCLKSVWYSWDMNPNSSSGAIMKVYGVHACATPTTLLKWVARIFTGK